MPNGKRTKKGPRARRRAIDAIRAIELGTLASDALLLPPGAVNERKLMQRRARRIALSMFKDMGGEGKQPEWRKQLVQRAAFTSIVCEELETKKLFGGAVDQEVYARATRTYTELLKTLGLDPTKWTGQFEGDITEGDITEIKRVIVHPRPDRQRLPHPHDEEKAR